VFDGIGGFSAATTVSNGGAIAPDNFGGSYSVDSSCQLTMSFGSGNTWSGFLMNNSTGANVIVSGPTILFGGFPLLGSVVSGTINQQ
jgi:hypothetical protein